MHFKHTYIQCTQYIPNKQNLDPALHTIHKIHTYINQTTKYILIHTLHKIHATDTIHTKCTHRTHIDKINTLETYTQICTSDSHTYNAHNTHTIRKTHIRKMHSYYTHTYIKHKTKYILIHTICKINALDTIHKTYTHLTQLSQNKHTKEKLTPHILYTKYKDLTHICTPTIHKMHKFTLIHTTHYTPYTK